MIKKQRGKQKVFSFNKPTVAAPEYVGHEVVAELTKQCTEVYADGADLVAVLNSGKTVRVKRTGDFLQPYRDLLKEIKK